MEINMELNTYEREYSEYLEPMEEGKKRGLFLFAPTFQSMQKETVLFNNETKIMMSSNNYLGLANHPEVLKAMQQAIDKYGASVCGARMHNGSTDLHRELEEVAAEFYGTEDAIVCYSGYVSNLIAVSGVSKDYDSLIITDNMNHMSINDGIKLSNSKVKIFSHNNMEKLEYILHRSENIAKKIIIVDGIYSMYGDMAPLDKIVELAEKYKARIMVDDAHGLGVFGENGYGTAQHFKVRDKINITVGTFSKALGNFGGCIASSRLTCEYIRMVANPYLFSVGIPPACVAGTIKAFQVMKRETWRREKLWENVNTFKQLAEAAGFERMTDDSPILPIFIGDRETTLLFASRLLELGVYVGTAVYPAVPPGKDMIRITISTNLTPEIMKKALDIMQTIAKEENIKIVGRG